MRHRLKVPWGFFLLGLGAQLQLFGSSLSFSELYVFLASPFFFAEEIRFIRRNKIFPFFILAVAVAGGCVMACIVNHSSFAAALRGCAVTFMLPCGIIVCHRMLRKNMNGFKWMLFGACISAVLCTFIFQQSVEVSVYGGGRGGDKAVEGIMSGPLFWISRVSPFVTLYPKGWYLQCPIVFSIAAPLIVAAFSMVISASGRSAALCAIACSILVLIGGKTRQHMRRVSRWFVPLLFLAMAGSFLAKEAYYYAATHGWLNEDSVKKFEKQSGGGSKGVLGLLLAGRMDSFSGLLACVDRPIVGFGPWAMDYWNYNERFLLKYGSAEDFEDYARSKQWLAKIGADRLELIRGHAFITQFWMWYGIFGLIFWLYVIFMLIRFLVKDCWVVPQWYMWIGAGVPGCLWNILFSPWGGNRVGFIMMMVACLMARAVRLGRQALPYEMMREINS